MGAVAHREGTESLAERPRVKRLEEINARRDTDRAPRQHLPQRGPGDVAVVGANNDPRRNEPEEGHHRRDRLDRHDESEQWNRDTPESGAAADRVRHEHYACKERPLANSERI